MVLLEVQDLKVHFEIQDGWVKAVDGVSFSIDSGETMGLVGESGCGKTTAAYAITQLLPPNGRIKGGRIFFKEPARVAQFRKEYDEKLKTTSKARKGEISRVKRKLSELNQAGRGSSQEAEELRDRLAALTYSFDLLGLSTRKDGSLDDYNEDIRRIRWTQISMIFQGAMNAFNPVFKVGDQIVEAITLHESVDENAARERAKKLFEFVGIAPDRIDNYPHEFSGGMKQRAMIALALALNPSFIIADEPTTALDVVTQDRILAEIKRLQEKLEMAMMIITHDVSVVAEVSDKIGVMYAGVIMEIGQTSQVFKNTAHPYTAGLLGSFPSIKGEKRRLISIPGFPPDLVSPPAGCPFHPRCQYAQKRCEEERPEGVSVEPGHVSYCHFAKQLWEKLRRNG
ncbi:MAG: ABC transporter ATP-binding protein [Methanobacteriota archaeon]|nr:MAG: ABC transporter ATP-binding protein [Euryarchaeota archaeon]